ncbi:molecular chaperone DnaJ [Alphaproteobacteria bacterium endosymbiont of Tiliacea citrago]|uniref:molecular chaperone DnaJ n=1 Tax=Alphaproteobacteria bacterium endosymbiont of Tiliacea citrago TaxID=3077944 RepID=UPI00313E09F2
MSNNFQDYYSVLGVKKEDSLDDIKKAYKKLVIKYHPDKFTDEKEKEKANSKFQEIQEAYDVLKDDQKRKQYDMLGHENFKNGGGHSGFDGFGGFDFNGSGFEDIFSDFFSGFGAERSKVFKGEDLRFSLEISLEEAFTGYETNIQIPRKVGCSHCASSGNDVTTPPSKCSKCNGMGKIHVQQFVFRVQQTCDNCNGSGKSYKKCSFCRGEGRLNETSPINIKIPKGVENGMKIQLKGKGNAIKGGVNGDLYVFVTVKKHSIFVVDNANLLLKIPISIFDAVLGKNVDIPTLEKQSCLLTIPAGTQPGSKLSISGKGMKRFNSEYRGDIIVTIEIEIPTYISSSEKDLWEKLHKEYKNTSKSKTFWDKLKSYWG